MPDWLQALIDWIQSVFEWMHAHPGMLWLLGALSVVTFVGSLFLVPFLVVRMGEDYFLPHRLEEKSFAGHHPVLRWIGLIGKNVLGATFLLAGIAMIFFPGQGVLTMVMGIMLMNFPGKNRLLVWLIRRRSVNRMINWLRRRSGHPPLLIPGEDAAPDDRCEPGGDGSE